jgi:heme-degrading monooxygenase HmoA
MISRQWRGLAKAAHAEEYVEHLKTDTFAQLRRIPGFVDASILTRKVERGVEFLIVTRWQSLEAIRSFAGEAAETAVVPQNVQRMMVEYDRRVLHYEVLE